MRESEKGPCDTEKYTRKLVAVLNEKIDTGPLMNALAQMTFGLGASIASSEGANELRFVDYADANGNSHANLSELPFIILKGSSNKIRELRGKLIKLGVRFVDFPNFVQSIGTFEDPTKSREFKEADITYYGIVMGGDWDTVTELTRKFSLWK